MALVADSSDPVLALEARLRAEFGAALAEKEERLLEAEKTTARLRAKVEEYEDEASECRDTLSSRRSRPKLVTEGRHRALPTWMPGCCRRNGEAASYSAVEMEGQPATSPMSSEKEKEEKKKSTRVPAETLLTTDGTHADLEAVHRGEIEFDLKDVPLDMWGVALAILTKDLAALFGRDHSHFAQHLTRFCWGFSCVAINLALQISILCWVDLYVVGAGVFNIQKNYALYHHQVYTTNGTFVEQRWETWDASTRTALCGAVLTKSVFLAAILFLWTSRMLGEFKQCCWLLADVYSLPKVPKWASTTQQVLKRDGNIEIIGVHRSTRAAMYSLVIIPKFAICLYLTWIGLRWLTATMDYGSLILNALALEFVISIDEQVLSYFLPPRTTDNLAKTKFAYPAKPEKTVEEDMQDMQRQYINNCLFFVFCVAFVWVYLRYIQQVVPNYEFDVGAHCGAWFEERYHPKCRPFETGCFPKGVHFAEPHQYTNAAVTAE